jgi:hypothetical protein
MPIAAIDLGIAQAALKLGVDACCGAAELASFSGLPP